MLHMSDQSWNSSWGSAAKVEAFPNGGDLPSNNTTQNQPENSGKPAALRQFFAVYLSGPVKLSLIEQKFSKLSQSQISLNQSVQLPHLR